MRKLLSPLVLAALFAIGFPIVFVLITTLPRSVAWRCSQALYRTFFRAVGIDIEVSGAAHLSRPDSFVLMGNHQSALDHFVLCVASPVPIVGLERARNLRLPIYGSLMRRWGNISVEAGDKAKNALHLAKAREALARERLALLIFPEGTRGATMGAFRMGGFRFVADAGFDVVPFRLDGAHQLMPRGQKTISAGRIRVDFRTALAAHASPEALADRVRTALTTKTA